MNSNSISLRIGHGCDVHRLTSGRRLILGGVTIPYPYGLLGHSDADVAVHAVMDAILGALALGDIGQWFPDNDSRWKDADSMNMLRQLLNSPEFAGCRLINLDLTIVAQAPKLKPFIPAMRENLAAAFNSDITAVSVKATTTEKLGFCGRGEGIAATAVVLLDIRHL
jgi:2-C-methyl-D-erythritol 2,4-cyclodiphosphate synthase